MRRILSKKKACTELSSVTPVSLLMTHQQSAVTSVSDMLLKKARLPVGISESEALNDVYGGFTTKETYIYDSREPGPVGFRSTTSVGASSANANNDLSSRYYVKPATNRLTITYTETQPSGSASYAKFQQKSPG